MLSEPEVRDRVEYCYCVLLQLGWLLGNSAIEAADYLDILRKSSLDLANDALVSSSVEEGIMAGLPDGGLGSLLSFYEGIVFALCQILETDIDAVHMEIAPTFLRQLASEVGVNIEI